MPETVEDEVAKYTEAFERLEAKLDAIAEGIAEIRGETVVPVGDLAPDGTPTELGLLRPTSSSWAGADGQASPFDLLPGRVGIEIQPDSGVLDCEVTGVTSDGNAIETSYAVRSDALRILVDVRLPAGAYWLPEKFRMGVGGRWTSWEDFPAWVGERIRADLG